MLVAWIATVYGLWQLIQLHEIQGRRFNRYHELGQYALGKHNAWLLIALCCNICLSAMDGLQTRWLPYKRV